VRGESPWPLLPAILLILVELALITAFALLFSSVTSPALAAIATCAVYVAGHLSWSLLLLKAKVGSGPSAWLCDLMYWITPNLERLNVKADVVHGIAPAPGFVALAAVYGMGYALLVLALACVSFGRRDFQ
jgi:ABC-type transport system involved in multi-copper enzyme maturation permease subunit